MVTEKAEIGDEKVGKMDRISSQNDEIQGSDERFEGWRAQESRKEEKNTRDVYSSRAKLKVRGSIPEREP